MINPKQHLSPEEYLAQEEKALDKHEYWNGETYLMAGTSRNHNLIAGNVYIEFRRKLAAKSCSVYTGDVRLLIQKEDSYTYPDVMVICGKLEIDPRQRDTVMNPTVIVQILSESTAQYDRSEKFKMYRQLNSLQDYVLIDQTAPYIEYFRRDGRFWVLETLEGMDAVLKLRSLDIETPISEIYAQVEWASPESAA